MDFVAFMVRRATRRFIAVPVRTDRAFTMKNMERMKPNPTSMSFMASMVRREPR